MQDGTFQIIQDFTPHINELRESIKNISSDIEDVNKSIGELNGKTEKYKKEGKSFTEERSKETGSKLAEVESSFTKSILSIKKDLRIIEERVNERLQGLQSATSKTIESVRESSEGRIKGTEKGIEEIKRHLDKIVSDFTDEVNKINALTSKEKKEVEGFMMNIVHHKADTSSDINKEIDFVKNLYTELLEKYKDLLLNDTQLLNDLSELKMCCSKMEAQYQDYIAKYVLTAKKNILSEVSDKVISLDSTLSETIEELQKDLEEQKINHDEEIKQLSVNIQALKKEIERLSHKPIEIAPVIINKSSKPKPKKKVIKKPIIKEEPKKKGFFGKIKDIFK